MDKAVIRAKTACFTGHRDLPEKETQAITERTKAAIQRLYMRGVRFFGVGGALGYDTIAADVLFQLRASYMPDIKVILVYPFDGFTAHWTTAQQVRHETRLPFYNKVVRIAERPSRDAYLARDRHLVNGSAYCIAYQTRNTGGTAYTVRYARKQGLIVYNIIDALEKL